MDLSTLILRAGYRFGNTDLLRQALTHRSYSAFNNERLEFLGDSVLNCVIADLLYHSFPALPEGDLTRLRAHLVNRETVSKVAAAIDLGAFLQVGAGERREGVVEHPSLLGNALEAMIGAAFLDGGFNAARQMVSHLFASLLEQADPRTFAKDAKTLLQEFLQSRRIPLPQYSVVSTAGEAHEQTFRVECAIPELNIRTQGEGSSRRGAEQVAARRAYDLGTQAS